MLSITAYHFQNSQALCGARRKTRWIPTTRRLSSRTNAKFPVTRYRERHRNKNQSAGIGDGLGLFRTTAAATRHLTIVPTRSCVAVKVNHNAKCIPLEHLALFRHLENADKELATAKARIEQMRQDAIANHRVFVGMTAQECAQSRGYPRNVNTTVGQWRTATVALV